RRRRSKKGREEESAKVRPIRNPADVSRLVETAAEHGTETRALVLALLDAGLRLGEALALRWCSIAWGSDEDDPRRHLAIDRTCSRGGELDSPKSGRARKVQLSRRLRAALGDLYLARFQRDPRAYEAEALIFAGIDHRRFREGIWARIIREADLPGVVPKDLRDTFGSWLVSMGIPLQYVSRQLGHSTTVVTEKHYARWIPEDDLYMEPERLRPGETPADLLARLSESPQSPHRGDPFAMPNFLQVP
ncbi:MAG: site-specific integrase, partial [Myxococcales bacterium]|nr:site-specific integrase [Myxococcales bacterium]